MGAPLVSALISTWNRAALVVEAVRSVQAQTVADREIIVVDDGSTDDTVAALAPFGDAIRVVRKANGGAASARNAAIALAGGRFLAFLDSDDEWLPDHLAAQLAAFDAQPDLGLVYGEYHSYEDGHLVGIFPRRPAPSGRAFETLLRASLVQTSTTMVPRTIAQQTSPFCERYRLADEYDFFLRIAWRWPIRYLPRPLCRYRVHGGNLSRDNLLFSSEMLRVYRDLAAEPALTPRQQRLVRGRVARYHYNVARELEARGRAAEAHTAYGDAVATRRWQGFPRPHLGWWRTRHAEGAP